MLATEAAVIGTAITGTAFQAEPTDPAELASLIHDDVLQSLGVATLGVDLCRRLHQRARYEQALAELTGIGEALDMARASTERIVPDLYRLRPITATRPSLRVLGQTQISFEQPEPSSHEIVESLSACALQARRCLRQYDAGLGEDTMRDLELLLQRLEFVTLAFREVLTQIREATTCRPSVGTVVLGPWARSA